MGDIIKGILGEVSGLVGTVVGAVVHGVATIRSRPRKSSKPPVQSQIDQRNKFAMVTGFMFRINPVINIGYQSFKNKMSPTNAAVQDALKNSVIGIAPDFELDYPNIRISKGNLVDSPTMELLPAVAGHKLAFKWDTAAELTGAEAVLRGLDQGVFLIYNETKDRSFSYIQVVERNAGAYSINFPSVFVGDKLHVYFFFVSPNGKSVSTSQYLGTTITLE